MAFSWHFRAAAGTGYKPTFGRTPKVADRTPVPYQIILAEFALLALWSTHVVLTLRAAHLLVAALMVVHAAFLAYAIGAFIGYRNSAADIAAVLMRRP